MPRNITVTFDDGSTHVYREAPDDLTPDQVSARAQQDFGKQVISLDGGRKKAATIRDDIAQGVGDLVAGAVRGAGSIGATLLYPWDKAQDLYYGDRQRGLSSLITNEKPLSRNEERRMAMDDALRSLGADPDSIMYKGGKIAGEIAGTAGVGGAAANVLTRVAPRAIQAAPVFQKAVQAISSGGMKLGSPAATTTAGRVADMAIRAGGGAVSGGLSAGLVNPEDASTGAVIGGLAPGVIRGVGAAGRAVRNSLAVSPEVANLARRASELGIDVPADRLANSKPLNALAASLEYVPFSGRAASTEKMTKQLNTALSRTFGQESDNVTMALRNASDELGGKFDEVLKANSISVNDNFLNKLAQVESTANAELVGDSANVINKQIAQIMDKAGQGKIDGQAAYNIKRTLDRLGRGQGPEAYHARELRDVLMDGLNDSLGPQSAKDFAKVRQQYGNMRALEKIAQNGAEGDISAGRLANMKNIKNKELQELADIAAQFVRTRENPHGALQRLVIGGVAGASAGTAGLPLLAGTAVAGRGINTALNSNALRNALINAKPVQAQIGADEVNKLAQFMARTAPVALTPSGNR